MVSTARMAASMLENDFVREVEWLEGFGLCVCCTCTCARR